MYKVGNIGFGKFSNSKGKLSTVEFDPAISVLSVQHSTTHPLLFKSGTLKTSSHATLILVNSAIHKAAGQASSQLERTPGVVPAAGSIHGLWEFQELYQAKSWNSREP